MASGTIGTRRSGFVADFSIVHTHFMSPIAGIVTNPVIHNLVKVLRGGQRDPPIRIVVLVNAKAVTTATVVS
jgi:hypothetical protein